MMSHLLLSSVLVCSVLVVFVSAKFDKVTDDNRVDEPLADGSPDFSYVNKKTKKAADKLIDYYNDAGAKLKKEVDKIKKSNAASKSLKEYEDLVKSVRGKKCEIHKENENQFAGAEANIKTTVQTCANTVLKDEFNILKATVSEDLVKVQVIDNAIRSNSQICNSFREPLSPSCREALKQSYDGLKKVLTRKEKDKLKTLSNVVLEDAKKSLKQCVNQGIESQQGRLKEAIKGIRDCKDK